MRIFLILALCALCLGATYEKDGNKLKQNKAVVQEATTYDISELLMERARLTAEIYRIDGLLKEAKKLKLLDKLPQPELINTDAL